MGNPVLFPFHSHTKCNDIVIVQINPVERAGTPRTAQEIYNRVNEITFNSSLLKELRSIDFVRRLLDDGKLDEHHYHRVRIHIVESHEALSAFGASSKVNAEWAFLETLHDVGQAAARSWVDTHYESIGERSTVDIRSMFEGIGVQHHG
jgi:NTE family protein